MVEKPDEPAARRGGPCVPGRCDRHSGRTLWLHRRGQERLPRGIARWSKARHFFELVGEAPGSSSATRSLIAWLTLLNALVFLADAATMQACVLALGVHAPFSAGYVAFMMASIAVLLGPVPWGLGSFEAVSIAMLRLFGVPFEAAVAATILFRGLTLWLPLIPGGLLLRHELEPRVSLKAKPRMFVECSQ